VILVGMMMMLMMKMMKMKTDDDDDDDDDIMTCDLMMSCEASVIWIYNVQQRQSQHWVRLTRKASPYCKTWRLL